MPSKTIGTGAVEIIPANTSRKSLIFQNEDSTDSIFIMKERSESLLVSTTVHDYKIGPGGILSLNTQNDGEQAIKARYTGVASANTPRLAFFETEDIQR